MGFRIRGAPLETKAGRPRRGAWAERAGNRNSAGRVWRLQQIHPRGDERERQHGHEHDGGDIDPGFQRWNNARGQRRGRFPSRDDRLSRDHGTCG